MKAILRSAALTSSERLVLLAIEGHADNVTGFAYPGVALLAKETALSKRTVITAIHAAADRGWLRIMPGKSPLDPRGNAYRVTPVQGDDFGDDGEGPVSG
jgi:homoserine kinase